MKSGECQTWLRLQRLVAEARDKLLENKRSVPQSGRTAQQLETGRRLQEDLFNAIAEIQQHQSEHGCGTATEQTTNTTTK
jgi:hypothetical protein